MSFKMIASSLLIFVLFAIGIVTVEISVYSNYANANATSQNTILTEQVLYNYETYFKNISNVSNLIQDKLYNNDTSTLSSEEESKYFDTVISVKPEIIDVGVYDANGKYLYGDSNNKKTTDVETKEQWFKAASSNELIDNFSSVVKSGDYYQIILSRYAETNKGQSNCIVRMDLNFTSIVNSIYQVDFGTGGHIVIYDKDYNLVYTSANTFADSEVTLLKDNVLGTNKVTINNHDFVITQYTISNTTWRVALFSNIDNVRSTNRQFVLLSVLICVIGCAVFSILIVFLVKTVTKPLNELQMAMNEVRNSDYLNYVPYEAKGSNEVEELNDSYNAMMKQIQKLMDNVVEEQNNQRKSEFKALTNQINPHFLYNTLDSIIYLIDEGKNDDAQTMVLALSKFFRISISKGRTIIPLHDEIEHIKNYLIIQKMRYKDAFTYTIKAEDDCLDYQVIKLILQPIVENAIYHGIKDKDKGTIDVYCHKEGEFLKLSVKDNGYGISSAKIAEIRESFTDPEVYNGVGLKNVYQRLKIYYGNKADVVIDSVLDVGTTITLVIPIKEATSNEEK
jgi:two-component system sensor histidine kinase YesM